MIRKDVINTSFLLKGNDVDSTLYYKDNYNMIVIELALYRTVLKLLRRIILVLGSIFQLFLFSYIGSAQGVPQITNRNPGDLIWETSQYGGRVGTFHRGYLLLNGLSTNSGPSVVLDIAPLEDGNQPIVVREYPGATNGHSWSKIGDVFRRSYDMPEFGNVTFADLSDMANIVEYTGPLQFDYQCGSCVIDVHRLGTYPFASYPWNNQLKDVRSNIIYDGVPDFTAGLGLGGEIAVGNLLFHLPLGPVDGLTIYDVSDPSNPRLLSVLTNPLSNYPDGWSVYRNYIILTTGDDSNEGGNNMVAVDFSDPSNPNVAFGFSVSEIGPARYSVFQDEYGFVSMGSQWHKINMETQQVQTFNIPNGGQFLGDFWPMPIGNLVVFLEGQTDRHRASIYVHQSELDTRGPEIGYHIPADGESGYSRYAGIGLVINECLASETVTSENMIVTRCSDDAVIPGIVVHHSFGTLNWVPDQPFEANTAYTFTMTSGLRDCAGNGANSYSFTFSTGSTLACEGGGGTVNVPPVIESFTQSHTSIQIDESVTFQALASDEDGDPLEYRWIFDDGSTAEWALDNSEVIHMYTEAGNYQIVLQVRDGSETTSDFVNLVVSEPTVGSIPTRSSPIVLNNENREVWVVNPDNNSITTIDADLLTVEEEVTVGLDPTSLFIDAFGNIWVVCRDADEVWVFDSSATLLNRIFLGRGSRPYGIVMDPDFQYAYVSEMGSGEISRIDVSTRTVDATLNIGVTPRALAIDPFGQNLFVTRMISGSDHGSIYHIDLGTFASNPEITLAIDAISPPTSGVAGPGIPNYVSSVAVNPNGNQLAYVSKKDNVFSGTSIDRNGIELTFERTIRSIIGKVDLAEHTELFQERLDIDDMGQPSSVVYSENGNVLFVTMQGNNLLIALDAFTGSELGRSATGLAPQGVIIDSASQRAFTMDFMGRSVSVYDAATVLSGVADSMPLVATISRVSLEILPPDVLLGKRIFYNSDDPRMTQQGDNDNGYISCASCHIDGTHDGITWDFTQRGEGLRNTTSLRGRSGMGHGRVHWSANFDEIQDFEHDMRNGFGGAGFMSNASFNEGTRNETLGDPKAGISPELDAIAAYLESLNTFDPSPYKPSNETFTADAIAGRTIFQDLGCAKCHAGNEFTNSATGLFANVGTLTQLSGQRLGSSLLGLDVPTLKDVWATAPYLHDGSAGTLRDVFNSHIGTATLGSVETNQLIAYLQQIDNSEVAIDESYTLAIDSPEPNSDGYLDQEMLVSVSTDIEDITRIVYYANGEEIGSSGESPFSISWLPSEEGVFDLQAKVVRGDGVEIISSDRVSYVSVAGNAPVEEPLTQADIEAIHVYPNPSHGIITIKGNSVHDKLIRISNLSGEILDIDLVRSDGLITLDLSKISSGIYLLSIGNSVTKKIVLK